LTIVIVGLLVLYALKQGPALLLQPPPEQRIAFASDRGGNPDIWTMKTDGSDARQVTNDAADDQIPSWSPDGKQLVSISDRRDKTYQVFVAAWDGRYVRCITSSEATKDMPVWNHDGREITFVSGGKVSSVKSSGGREEQYLPTSALASMTMSESSRLTFGGWSGGDKYLFYVRETDRGKEVYAADRAAMAASDEEATDQPQEDKPVGIGITAARDLSIAVAPKRVQIAVSFIDRGGQNGILTSDLDKVETRDIYVFPESKHAPGKIAWSPDGTQIAFEVWTLEDGTPNMPVGIYAIEAPGGKPRVIIEGDTREPTWSPDGRQLACTVISEDGKRDIWRVNADGTSAVNLTKGQGDNYNPAWSPR